jgi:hypothetical protein
MTVALSLLVAPTASAKGGGGGGGSGPPATLPADWPASVPVPSGTIQGSTGAAPSEVVALVVDSSYPAVVTSVTALYASRGFTQLPDGTLVFSTPSYRVTVVGSARDHSPTQTNVVIWLQTL